MSNVAPKKILKKKTKKIIVIKKKNSLQLDEDIWGSFLPLKNSQEAQVEEDNDNERCQYCQQNNLISNYDGLIVCSNCGATADKIIDHSAEWRYYGYNDNKNSDPTRCGLPINNLLPQSSMCSVISNFNRNDSYEMKKIRRYHTWNSVPYKERALHEVFDSFSVALNNGVPICIVEEAKSMYKVLSEAKISRGSNRKGLIASCIYMACKKGNVPRSAKEIADMFDLDITVMTNGCKNFIEIWNMVNKEKGGNIVLNASQSHDFIHRFCSKLNVSPDILNLCIFISEKAEEFSIVSENTPPSIAAGSIYLACQLANINISKKDISDVCKISEVTISKCYKRLYKYKDHLVPKK